MAKFERVSFSEIIRVVKESPKVVFAIRNLSYWPALVIYGLTIIALLKIAQVVL